MKSKPRESANVLERRTLVEDIRFFDSGDFFLSWLSDFREIKRPKGLSSYSSHFQLRKHHCKGMDAARKTEVVGLVQALVGAPPKGGWRKIKSSFSATTSLQHVFA